MKILKKIILSLLVYLCIGLSYNGAKAQSDTFYFSLNINEDSTFKAEANKIIEYLNTKDSIIFDKDSLPLIFRDPCYDFNHKNLIIFRIHNKISCRWEILNKIDNLQILSSILNLDLISELTYCTECNQENISDPPYCSFTLQELVKLRISTLKK